jgi:DNA helicase-2/ATP-dependent DNA helicase PcrA
MTRARNELHLCAPLKYQVTQQPKDGDKHVYGAKSRFMTDKVLDSFERISLRNMRGVESLRDGEAAVVDVGSQLKDMW